MAMLEKHRNVLYKHFVDELGEEATQAMLAHFPARDVEEPVTRADLAATSADLRSDLAASTAAVRSELAASTADLRSEIHEVSLGLESLRTEMHRLLNRQLVALTTVIGIAVGIVLGAG